jgi:hypothetical protein
MQGLPDLGGELGTGKVDNLLNEDASGGKHTNTSVLELSLTEPLEVDEVSEAEGVEANVAGHGSILVCGTNINKSDTKMTSTNTKTTDKEKGSQWTVVRFRVSGTLTKKLSTHSPTSQAWRGKAQRQTSAACSCLRQKRIMSCKCVDWACGSDGPARYQLLVK